MYSAFNSILKLIQLVLLINTIALSQSEDNVVNWPYPVFEHLTLADGLPENSVVSIFQDHLGYLWLGTQVGLVRYDGYNIRDYQPKQYDSLKNTWGSTTGTMYEDKMGTIWIGTLKGLDRFNSATDRINRFRPDPDNPSIIIPDSINCIIEVNDGNLLIGSSKGLYLFDSKHQRFSHIYYKKSIYSKSVNAFLEDRFSRNVYIGTDNKMLVFNKDKHVLTDDDRINRLIPTIGSINSFCKSGNDLIWIGHSMGLTKLDLQSNSVWHYQVITSSFYNELNYFHQLIEDDNGFLWLIAGSGENGSLMIFDSRSEKFKRIENDPDNPLSISSTKNIFSICKDRTGIIWVGTLLNGLNKWDSNRNRFKRTTQDFNKAVNRDLGRVRCIVEDAKAQIWFGTKDGLNSFNRKSGEIRNYKYDSRGIDNTVTFIYLDDTGLMWLGTETRGLVRFDPVGNTYYFYSNDPNNIKSIGHNTIRYIFPNGKDILWIGTRDGGLNKFDKSTGDFIRYLHDVDNPLSLSNDRVEFIILDRKGTMWIATQGIAGLNRFDRNNNSFKSFSFVGGGPVVLTIYEDRLENLWVGTMNKGISLFNRDKETFISTIQLGNNLVRSILEDNSSNLWIGTDYGLSRLDTETQIVRDYIPSDNFEGNRFSVNSAFKTSTGEMLFGTYDGFIMFHPDDVKDDPMPPQIVISEVSLFNRPGEELEYDILTPEMKELNLSHSENDLRFDYVGLHYADPQRNKYKYMLEGYDKDWVDAGTQRNATYTNLEPGNYKFKVKAANSDGVWSEEESAVKINISNPWWSTEWAYAFYVLLFAAGLIALRRFELNRSRLKNLIKMQDFEAKKQHEVDEMKTRFIANLSHEFRTPLLLIKGPLEQMMNDNLGSKNLERCTTVIRNTENLQTLINQLLELSQLESSSIPVKAQKINLITLLRGLIFSFESLAKEKNIKFLMENVEETIFAWIDREKFEKIINNLVSNAFKFTKHEGRINICIKRIVVDQYYFAEIKVSDTGIGISQAKLEKIFDRFYQIDDSIHRTYGGSGIGLALVKELVDLHKWDISVSSKNGEGAEFYLKIPLAEDYLDENQKVTQSPTQYSIVENGKYAPTDSIQKKLIEYPIVNEIYEETNQDYKPCLLIVEDSKDVQVYLDDILNSGYSVLTAMNGIEGLKAAQEKIPDLIISDVMMPEMDGFEFCKRLKTDERTSHIPVILLTAKATSHDKIEGLETGADDYIMKPFEANELKVRIRNLIEQRKKLREYFKKQSAFDLIDANVTSVDKKFLEKTFIIINNHISDTGFSVDVFADEIGMSRSQLHRKLVNLIGESPGELIRRIRLNKAAKLIEQKFGNISEIAMEVGFNNPANFAQSFRKQFGVSPTEYKK